MNDLIRINETTKALHRMKTDSNLVLLKARMRAAILLLDDIAIELVDKPASALHAIDEIASSRNGNIKINRIKVARETLYISLRDAKEYVEHHFDQDGRGELIE